MNYTDNLKKIEINYIHTKKPMKIITLNLDKNKCKLSDEESYNQSKKLFESYNSVEYKKKCEEAGERARQQTSSFSKLKKELKYTSKLVELGKELKQNINITLGEIKPYIIDKFKCDPDEKSFYKWFGRKAVSPELSFIEFLQTTKDEIKKEILEYAKKEKISYDELLKTLEGINNIEIKDKRKNTFNSMNLTSIETYFSVLKTENNKDKEKYLTPDKFDQFISKAFCNTDIKPITLNLGTKENQTIYDLFYSYFKYCISDYNIEPTQQCKAKYVKLLSDNFTNFSFKKVNNNFEKTPLRQLSKNLPKI